MEWEVHDGKESSAADNMAFDEFLLKGLADHPRPILHIYRWKGVCATYGHFINPADYFLEEGLTRWKLDIARRPTGGGILFHHCDLAFAVLIPKEHPKFSVNTLENYAYVNHAVIGAIRKFLGAEGMLLPSCAQDYHNKLLSSFCMAKPTKYDVMLDGRKVGGAAQRRTKDGFLHQGTIAMMLPSEKMITDVLQNGSAIFEAMHRQTFPLLKQESQSIEEIRPLFRDYLLECLVKGQRH